jgi:hypothetical protein
MSRFGNQEPKNIYLNLKHFPSGVCTIAKNHIMTRGFDVSGTDLCQGIKTDTLTRNNSFIWMANS